MIDPPTGRYEFKYLITPTIVTEIKKIASKNLIPDKIGKQYVVCNTYLDNEDLSLYNDHLKGKNDRYKLRIRDYDGEVVFFEVKRKYKGMTIKNREEVEPDDVNNLLNTQPNGSNFLSKVKQINAFPVVKIKYNREAYESNIEGEYIRLTIDNDIRCQPVSKFSLFKDGKWELIDNKNPIILELKFLKTMPEFMKDMIDTFDLKKISYSKYLTAIDKIF